MTALKYGLKQQRMACERWRKNNINDLIKEAVALETTGKIGFYYLDKKNPEYI